MHSADRGRLWAWLALAGVLAALNYASRYAAGSSGGKSPLYTYSAAVAGLIQLGIILGVVLWIAHGKPLREWMGKTAGITLEIVLRSSPHTFQVVKRRWVVERTFGWLMRYRRLARDYERRTEHHEAMVWWATVFIMTKRLARYETGQPNPPRWGAPRPRPEHHAALSTGSKRRRPSRPAPSRRRVADRGVRTFRAPRRLLSPGRSRSCRGRGVAASCCYQHVRGYRAVGAHGPGITAE